jgi:hypothetical protein
MTTEVARQIERLPALIDRATAHLAKAKTAAEVLEAHHQATNAYNEAKHMERMAKAQKAHDDIIEACREIQIDALDIEARAEARLADEYDAAQARGELAKRGEIGRGRSSQIEHLSTNADTGLTHKQIHEARHIRDAEKREPGIVKKSLQAKLKSKKGPSRADVKRAVQPTKPKQPRATPILDKARDIVRPFVEAGRPANSRKLQDEHGISHVHFETATAVERALKDTPPVDVSTLSMSAQEKLEIAIRQAKRKLEAEYEQRVQTAVREAIEMTVLPYYQKEYERCRSVVESRKGITDKATYRTILSCLHPDRVQDEALKRRYEKAFHLFTKLELLLLDERESPTAKFDMPKTYQDWMALKEKVKAERKAQRDAKRSGVTHR